MTIFVNSYLGHLEKTVIGRVYVEDKDDWDLPDKVFTWAPGKSLPGFSLATNGEVMIFRIFNLFNSKPRIFQFGALIQTLHGVGNLENRLIQKLAAGRLLERPTKFLKNGLSFGNHPFWS